MSRCHTWNPRRGDVPKKRYDRRDAVEAARSCERDIGGSFSAYRCSFCGRWHVGKTPARRAIPHADEARLLEVGERAVRAEQAENNQGGDRCFKAIQARGFKAAALAAGYQDGGRQNRRKSVLLRAQNRLYAEGWFTWSRDLDP